MKPKILFLSFKIIWEKYPGPVYFYFSNLFFMILSYLSSHKQGKSKLTMCGCLCVSVDIYLCIYSYSVQFRCSVVSDSLRPHEPQHARPPCPSLKVHPNSCPLSRWCHPTISSSVIPFSCCPQFFPASRSFQINQLFASGGQSIGVSASTSVLPMNTQDWSLGWTGWIALQAKGLSRVFSNTTVQKHQFFSTQLSL